MILKRRMNSPLGLLKERGTSSNSQRETIFFLAEVVARVWVIVA